MAILGIFLLLERSEASTHAWVGALLAMAAMPAFLGAAYGPVLIPVGAGVLLWTRGAATENRRVGWAFIVTSLLATAMSYLWLLDAVQLP